ncbi:DDB1- and CUL4-associated factor 13 [Aplysia californica]|uniref:DDB1- and CUL4-associated factor 13 n=1 Tax=Aplysia californica TaxID=6500 RepID=A0ABM0JWN4_APLCA|nr:DDB1- and CUL4-associated factor 13 [Aplysia californica]
MAAVRKKKNFSLKVLSRNPDDYKRETKLDIHKAPQNPESYLHPFAVEREYKRALNATKLERVFAKPFLCGLEGHRDSIEALAKFPTRLSHVLSSASDGEIRLWDLTTKKCLSHVPAHDGVVHSLCAHRSGNFFLSCGQDTNIKLWACSEEGEINPEPVRTILNKYVYQSIDHHEKEDMFVACGQSLDLWVGDRAQPYQSYKWGLDSMHFVKFNRTETHLVAACADDRSIMLYDTRGGAGVSKLVMRLKSNAISWNPMQAFVFTAACDDYNLYTYDIRNLRMATNKHEDHIAAVMDVDYAPTGKEFATAGYDRAVRIFNHTDGHSRDVYHTKRMQRVNHIMWSMDNKYILSGSDEMNVRLWKARASEKLGVLKPREKTAINTAERLKRTFKDHPEIQRISRHRHLPRLIYHYKQEHQDIKESQKRKESNRRFHSKPGAVPHVPERKKQVVDVKE